MKLSRLTGAFLSLILAELALPGSTSPEGLNFISNLSGEVQLKRVQWDSYQPAVVGTLVYFSDWLRLGKGATATVQCHNLSLWDVPSGKDSSIADGCHPTRKSIVRRPGSTRLTPRTANDPTIPYIISPRNTAILSDQPTLRWHPVTGANRYQVQVRGPGVNWTTQVSQPEVAYAGNPLKAEWRYRIIVTADSGASSSSEAPVGFTLMADEEAQRVKAEVGQVQQQALGEEAKTLALAHLYRSNNLNAAAVALLEKLIQKGNRTASVYQLVGELYQQVGLNRLARERYLKALELAKAKKNLEGEASVKASLGEVDTALARLDEAIQWYRKAQAGYQKLGDGGRVRKLQQKLDELAGR